MEFGIFEPLAIALGLGLLVGTQRERDEEHRRIAGVRTFGLIGLLGGAFASLAKVTVRRLGRSEPSVRVVCYFTAISTLISAVPMLWAWQTPTPVQWGLLALMGLLGTLGQFLLTRGYAIAAAASVSPFTYFSVIFGAIYGYLFWGETLTLQFTAGALLIALAGLLIALVAAGVSLWISRRITRPIEAMKKSAGHFADGDFSHRLAAPDSEEMAGLADALNQMAAQLDRRIQTIVSQHNELETVLASMLEGVIAVDNDFDLIYTVIEFRQFRGFLLRMFSDRVSNIDVFACDVKKQDTTP